jgi:hypothetical protein
MKTIREKLVVVLEGGGWQRDWAVRTRKYWVYRHAKFEKALYLGKAGALRFGMTVSGTRAVEGFKANLLARYAKEAA